MNDLLLGIDIGTTSVKACLFTPDGKLQAAGDVAYPTQHLRPGWVEQQAEDWWRAACDAIHAALASIPDGASRIAALAVSAQAPTLIPLDKDGQPVRPALIWMDRRAEAEVAALNAEFGEENIVRTTGNRADAFYLAAKLRWFTTHEPELAARTARYMQINGYINYRLTGAYSLDRSHAALLQLMRYGTDEFDPALCAFCGVRPEQFSIPQDAHITMGEVTHAAGLRFGTPVLVGTVDGAAAALEAGVSARGIAAEMTGTSTVLLMANDGAAIEPTLIAMPHAVPGLHLLLGAMVASGASLRWFRDQLGAEDRRTAQAWNMDAFDLLTAQAGLVGAGSDGVVFLPYMMGERAPIWHTNARGVWFGLSLTTRKAALIRSILEGTAFALRHNVEVAAGAGVDISEVRSVGGGAKSALWSRIKADVLGIPVKLPGASVGAPFGNALLAGVGAGLYTDLPTAMRETIHIAHTFEPDPAAHALYDQIYPLYRQLYEHLRGDFDAAAQIFATTPKESGS